MARIVLLTDNEPIDPLANPVITLEQAKANPTCFYAVSIMRSIDRQQLTRLQYIEVIMIENSIRKWSRDREYGDQENPLPLQAEDEYYYVPDYLSTGKAPIFHYEDEESDSKE